MSVRSFVLVGFFTLLLLSISLHGSLVRYIEQQYHNFSESKSATSKALALIWERSFLQENALFALADSFSDSLEEMRSAIIAFLAQGTEPKAKKQTAKNDKQTSQKPKKPKKPKAPKEPSNPQPTHHHVPLHEPQSTQEPAQSPQSPSISESQVRDSEIRDSEILEAQTLGGELQTPPNPQAPQTSQATPTQEPFTQEVSESPSQNTQSSTQTPALDSETPLNATATEPPTTLPTMQAPATSPTMAGLDANSPAAQSTPQTTPQAQAPKPQAKPKKKAVKNPRIRLESGDSVLLIGDSMMQGSAPYMLKAFKKLNLNGINLSKHSTGLTYKHYFDWAKATSEAFERDPNITLVVVLMGANDPWGMKKQGGNLAFKSPEWEEIYRQRIDEIITIAHSYGARVAWYEVPYVRDEALNKKIIYLNSLYEAQVRQSGELYFKSNGILTQGGRYDAFIKDHKGNSVQVRIDDGVHFTSRGYWLLANILLSALDVSKDEGVEP